MINKKMRFLNGPGIIEIGISNTRLYIDGYYKVR